MTERNLLHPYSDIPELDMPTDENFRLHLIQEGMERELIESGITAVLIESNPEVFENAASARFYPYKGGNEIRTSLMVSSDVFGNDPDTDKTKQIHPAMVVGVEQSQGEGDQKRQIITPLSGFSLSDAMLVASMIKDLESKRESGELPNLSGSCSAIIK